VAEDLLICTDLPHEIRHFLELHRGPFLLGHTSPDVQSISGQQREITHFFTLPVQRQARTPWEHIFTDFPVLDQVEMLSGAQIAFLAGYLCHLQADWYWADGIFTPVFGPRAAWADFRQRLYLHNVLRAYLDRQALNSLNGSTRTDLASTAPKDWLPFVKDQHLYAWRDWLTAQLNPGAEAETVEVFAARQGISSADYYLLLDSEADMDREIFSRLPRQNLAHYRQLLLEENVLVLQNYVRVSQGGSHEG
jgi:hypothetical protein